MGFDDAERSEATQTLELSEEDYKDDGLIPLRYVKFQNVQSVTVRSQTLLLKRRDKITFFVWICFCYYHKILHIDIHVIDSMSFFSHQLFIKSNQGDEETTKINYLTFIGTPVQATNMNDFKRVRSSHSDPGWFLFRCVCCTHRQWFYFVVTQVVGKKGESHWAGERMARKRRRRRGWGGGGGCRYIQGLSLCQSCHTHSTVTHTQPPAVLLKLWMNSPSGETLGL